MKMAMGITAWLRSPGARSWSAASVSLLPCSSRSGYLVCAQSPDGWTRTVIAPFSHTYTHTHTHKPVRYDAICWPVHLLALCGRSERTSPTAQWPSARGEGVEAKLEVAADDCDTMDSRHPSPLSSPSIVACLGSGRSTSCCPCCPCCCCCCCCCVCCTGGAGGAGGKTE